MTDKYGPMEGAGNSVGEAEWYDYAPTWAPSGVIGVPATAATSGDLAFSSSGLNVSAGPGIAWVHGAGFKRTGTPPTHAATVNAHATWQRRDRLVLRRDLANNQVVTAVLQGTPAASPVAPALTQVEAGVWEMPLHSFLVPPASGTSITGVVDERVWVDPGARLVATMARRPTTNRTAGDRIRPLDQPQIQYTWDGTRWVQDGVPAAVAAGAPADSYVSRYEGSIDTTVTGGDGPGSYGVALAKPFSAAPLWSEQKVGYYSFVSLATLAVQMSNSSAGVLVGFALRANGATVPNGSAVRINYVAIGYNT